MKKIQLTHGQFALVDDEDFGFLNQWKWHAKKKKRTTYAARSEYLGKINGKYKSIEVQMHRVILNAKKGNQVDHRDHNGLNNQKSNIREVTIAQNRINRNKTLSQTSSKYKGVSLIDNIRKNRWRSYINVSGKAINIGCYPSQELAAIAYNEVAKKYHGEFASLNII